MEVAAVPSVPACLCLGPKQSGKTHLLTSLQSSGSITNVSHSVQTIGTNIFTIKLPDLMSKSTNPSATVPATADTVSLSSSAKRRGSASFRRSMKKPSIIVTEIGGSMAPMWSNYLNNVSKIMYVIDTSNLCQISAAGEFYFFTNSKLCLLIGHFLYKRCTSLFASGWSTITTHQIFIDTLQNGLGLSTNEERSFAHVTIR